MYVTPNRRSYFVLVVRNGDVVMPSAASSQEPGLPTAVKLPAAALSAPRAPAARPARSAGWVAVLLALLLLINAALYWKLYYADRPGYSFDLDDLQNR